MVLWAGAQHIVCGQCGRCPTNSKRAGRDNTRRTCSRLAGERGGGEATGESRRADIGKLARTMFYAAKLWVKKGGTVSAERWDSTQKVLLQLFCCGSSMAKLCLEETH